MSPAGHVDFFTIDLLTGWAWDPEQPDEPVEVMVRDETQTILKFKADLYRSDLAAAGIGDGRHAFSLEALHSVVPWSRRNLSVARAHDGVVLNGEACSLIATGSPHLFLSPDGGTPCVVFGDGLYQLADGSRFAELAAWLPMTLPEEADDPLTMKGRVHLSTSEYPPSLLFDDLGTAPFKIPIDGSALAGPHVRICRGRARAGGWVRDQVTLEIENAIGIELRCMLPERAELGPKALRVVDPEGLEQQFELSRGSRTAVAIRIMRRERHRLYLSTEPEENRASGFLLCGLDVVARDADLRDN